MDPLEGGIGVTGIATTRTRIGVEKTSTVTEKSGVHVDLVPPSVELRVALHAAQKDVVDLVGLVVTKERIGIAMCLH